MVHFRRFIGLAAAFSTLNLAVALPQPGGDLSQQNSYGSGSQDNNYGSNSGYDSSKDSNKGSYNSGYDSSKDSNKGSYNSGYDSSKDSYNNGYDGSKYSDTTTSSKMQETKTSTSSSMKETTTSSMTLESTSTESSSSTETAAASSTSVIYGSGSMNSDSNSYNDCVAQCIASFSPTSTASSVNSGSSGSVGTGATKTVIVAPSQGVLRYVPFAVNASVGDTIKFIWKAGPHTVTKGSALQPCNATSDGAFASGKQNASFEFTQEVTSTDPTFFFCGVPNHCQKGMFGVINPPSNLNAPTSASGMMQSLKANNSDLKAYAAITDTATSGKPAALWGGGIDMAGMPDWAQPLAAENILYTRNLLASNPELLQDDGTIDMSNADATPLLYPKDVSDALKDAATSAPSTTASPAAGAAGAAATTSAAGSAPTSGASLTTPRAVLALVAVAATALML